MAIKTNTYVGNGLQHDITGVGFMPDIVYVALMDLAGVSGWFWRRSNWPATNGQSLQGQSWNTNTVRNFVADGFTIGINTDVNDVGRNYAYVAIKLPHTGIEMGTYVGDAIDNRIIPVAFPPKMAYIQQPNVVGQFIIWRTDVLPVGLHAHRISGGDIEATSIRELVPTGIKLGTNAQVNGAGITYEYLAFGAQTSATQFYTGTGVNGRILPVLPIKPISWVIIGGAMNPPPGAIRFGRARSDQYPLNRSIQIVRGQPATDGQIIDFPGQNSVTVSNIQDGNLQDYNALGIDYQLFALGPGGGPSKIGKRLH